MDVAVDLLRAGPLAKFFNLNEREPISQADGQRSACRATYLVAPFLQRYPAKIAALLKGCHAILTG